eukprot:3228980-Amphidinium_carterae.1
MRALEPRKYNKARNVNPSEREEGKDTVDTAEKPVSLARLKSRCQGRPPGHGCNAGRVKRLRASEDGDGSPRGW